MKRGGEERIRMVCDVQQTLNGNGGSLGFFGARAGYRLEISCETGFVGFSG